MKKIVSLAIASLLFTAATASSSTAWAAAETYTYDPLHTQVLFSINHMGYTNVHGRFDKFTGGFTFDEQKPEASTANITIDVNSIDLPDATWNEHTKEKLLEAAKFPAISFKSTGVKKTGDKTAALTGDLTLHGVTRPVTLNVIFNKAGTNPMMQNRKDAGFTVTGTIKRSNYGLGAFIPMVGDEVALTIEVDGTHEDTSKVNK
jgi:polyisoprenoid-binding protein YceI